jgi:integrase
VASVFQRSGSKVWVVKYKDHRGVQVSLATKATSRSEAKLIASDLEKKAERQRLGLEAMPHQRDDRTLAALMKWWLDNHSVKTPSHDRNKASVEKHLLGREGQYRPAPVASTPLKTLTTGQLNAWLDGLELEEQLAPQTLNHLRMFVHRAWEAAVASDWWSGLNPAAKAKVRKVPRRLPSFLLPEEAPAFLRATSDQWRPFFATALYTGMRQGELAGLLKREVMIRERLITVGHSYDRDRPKGGDEAPIPIAAALVPYLEEAMGRSKGQHVFTTAKGKAIGRKAKFDARVQSTLRAAGLVSGWVHKCRRRGCGYRTEVVADDLERRCPKVGAGGKACGFKLWPVGVPKRLRFHDLRHTTASLLLMSGVPLVVVSRILRHSDPRITDQTYGHLVPGWLQGEVDKLNLSGPRLATPAGPKSGPDGAPVVQKASDPTKAPEASGEKPKQ